MFLFIRIMLFGWLIRFVVRRAQARSSHNTKHMCSIETDNSVLFATAAAAAVALCA